MLVSNDSKYILHQNDDFSSTRMRCNDRLGCHLERRLAENNRLTMKRKLSAVET